MDPETLQSYGPWALLSLALTAILFLYRANATEREAAKKEMAALMQQLITTTKDQVTEYARVTANVSTTLETLSRRIEEGRQGNGRR